MITKEMAKVTIDTGCLADYCLELGNELHGNYRHGEEMALALLPKHAAILSYTERFLELADILDAELEANR